MDSRLLRNSIFIGILMVVIICGIVYYLNQKNGTQTVNSDLLNNQSSQTEAVVSETGEATDYRGFMKNDMFFDQEDTSLIDSTTSGSLVTLVLTSVEKDIRIQIQDLLGNLITGETFQVSLENGRTYTDEDQDGLIYIDGLVPGDYNVTLEPLDGYQITQTALQVKVSEKAAYDYIQDIGLFIMSESHIDVLTEDTEVLDAAEVLSENQKSEVLTQEDVDKNGVGILGIDVSAWNGEIDWAAVKNAGVTFAIIRCGYRGSFTGAIVEDSNFISNIEGANQEGIQVGISFFSQAANEVEAIEEASAVINLCQGYLVKYPVFIKMQSAGGNGRADALSAENRTNIAKAFMETVTNSGYVAGVYSSKNWFENHLNIAELENQVIWLGEFGREATYTGPFNIWQFTSNGTVDGIEGKVNMNLNYSDYETID